MNPQCTHGSASSSMAGRAGGSMQYRRGHEGMVPGEPQTMTHSPTRSSLDFPTTTGVSFFLVEGRRIATSARTSKFSTVASMCVPSDSAVQYFRTGSRTARVGKWR
eukprot:2561159-Rhodomonas_salina.2